MNDFQSTDNRDDLPITGSEPRQKKLQTARILGIISVIYGGLVLLLSIGGTLAGNFFSKMAANQPGMEGMMNFVNDPKMKQIQIISVVLALIVNVLLITGGIQLIKKRILGRTLSLAGAFGAIVSSICGIIMQFLVVAPLQEQYSIPSSKLSSISGICCFVYPIVLLVFMLPQSTAEALKEEPPSA